MLNFQKFYFWYNNNLPLTVTDDMSVLETLYRLINEFNDVLEETETQFNALEADVHQTYQKWEERFQTFTTDLWDKFNEYKDLIDTEIETFESKINTQYEDLTGQWNQTKADWENYKDSMTAWKNQTDAEIQSSLNNMELLYNNVNAFYTNMQTGWTTIQTEFAGMKSEWQAFHASVEMVIDGFQKDLDEMSGRVTANEADIALLKKSVSGDNKALSSLIDTVGVRPPEFTGSVWNEIEQNHNDFENVSNELTQFENSQSVVNSTVNTKLQNGFVNLKLYHSEMPTIAGLENTINAEKISGFYLYDNTSYPNDMPGTASDFEYGLYSCYYKSDSYKVEEVEYINTTTNKREKWIKINSGNWGKVDYGAGSPVSKKDFVNHLKFAINPSPMDTSAFYEFTTGQKDGVLAYATKGNMIYIYDWPSDAQPPDYLYFTQTYSNDTGKYVQTLYCFYSASNSASVYSRLVDENSTSTSWNKVSFETFVDKKKFVSHLNINDTSDPISAKKLVNFIYDNYDGRWTNIDIPSIGVRDLPPFTISPSIYKMEQFYSDSGKYMQTCTGVNLTAESEESFTRLITKSNGLPVAGEWYKLVHSNYAKIKNSVELLPNIALVWGSTGTGTQDYMLKENVDKKSFSVYQGIIKLTYTGTLQFAKIDVTFVTANIATQAWEYIFSQGRATNEIFVPFTAVAGNDDGEISDFIRISGVSNFTAEFQQFRRYTFHNIVYN